MTSKRGVMNELAKKSTKKIDISCLFIVMVTRNYLDALRNLDGDILTQIDIARKFQKPFFIIIDKRLSNEEAKEIEEYFSKDNIIKRMTIDIFDTTSKRNIALEIKRLVRELSGKDEEIRITTQYSRNEEDKK